MLPSFKEVVSGAKQMIESTRLAEFRSNVAGLNNRAILEIPEILAKLLGESTEAAVLQEAGVAAAGRRSGDSV